LRKQRFLSNFQNGQKGEILAIGGGKGGTGKSFITSNLGIHLAKMGNRVILIDADLGCANLHTCLGIEHPELTLSDFMQGKVEHIKEVIIPTGIPNLTLISGAKDFLEVANPLYSQKMRLIRMINQLDFDYILLDLGAGTSFNILDFFLISDNGILVVLPEPTSIENVYRFIKAAFFRKLKQLVKNKGLREIITTAMDQKNQRGIKTPHDLIEQIGQIDDHLGRKLQREIYSLSPKIIVNQVRSPDDMALGFSMRGCCSQYFGINVEYLGYIDYDNCVWQANKINRPLVTESPYASSSRCIEKISHNLLKKEQLTLNGYFSPRVAYR
jgi:flagellar biosynthesis protein FlhG